MSYDFFLFEPEATQPLTSLILSDNAHLNARYEAENTTTTTQLRQACARINHDSIQFATLDDPIMIEDAAVSGDRTIVVHTVYSCAERTADYLLKVALEYGLGVADVSSNRVLAAGDESAQLHLSAPDWEAPGYSPTIVALLPTYILRTNATNPFFIVVDPDNDERYVQACVAAIDEATEPWEDVSWRIEYRAGDADHHYGTFVTGDHALTTRVQQWVAQSPEFFELEWEKMDFSDYEFDED